jgi:hypothetical protein
LNAIKSQGSQLYSQVSHAQNAEEQQKYYFAAVQKYYEVINIVLIRSASLLARKPDNRKVTKKNYSS